MGTGPTRGDLVDRDARDPLAGLRARFDLPDGVVYLDGNSLGPLPAAAVERLATVMREQWGRDLIKSWNDHDWINLPARLGDKIAGLIGADAGEVVVADSTSVNLFKLLAAALPLRPGRTTILSEERNFPTDLYVAQGLAGLLGDDLDAMNGVQIACIGPITAKTAADVFGRDPDVVASDHTILGLVQALSDFWQEVKGGSTTSIH